MKCEAFVITVALMITAGYANESCLKEYRSDVEFKSIKASSDKI